MTRNERIAMYSQHPGALAEELANIFGQAENEADVAIHNYTIERLKRLCPDPARLLENVAKAVLRTAREGLNDGQKTEQTQAARR